MSYKWSTVLRRKVYVMREIVLCHTSVVDTKSAPRGPAGFLLKFILGLVKVSVVAVLAIVLLRSALAYSAPSPDELLKSVVTIETDAGSGSGVILDSSGVIATNVHVLEDSTTVSIKLQSGDVYRFESMTLIASDEVKDIAIIKIPGFELPAAKLGNSNSARLGQDVFAMGAPAGYEGTVSRGIISAIRDSGEGFKLLQIDAAISPGSSGGALFNTDGELIGIVVGYIEDAQNLNFAIPINYYRGMLSSDAKMTLREYLATSPSTTSAASQATGNKMEIWVAAITEFFDVEPESNSEGVWLFETDGGNFVLQDLDQIVRVVKMFSPPDDGISHEHAIALLKANFSADYVKVALTGEDVIHIALEVPKAHYSKAQISEMMRNLFELISNTIDILVSEETTADIDSAWRLLPDSYPPIEEFGSRGDLFTNGVYEQEYKLLYDTIRIRMPAGWKLTRDDTGDDGSRRLGFISGRYQTDVIAELIDAPGYNWVPALIEKHRSEANFNGSVIGQGYRSVNGRRFFWQRVEGDYDQADYAYEYNIVGAEGVFVQIITYTSARNDKLLERVADSVVRNIEIGL